MAAAVEQGHTTAYDHFINHGIHEGRKPFAAFDADFYLACNPDVAGGVASGQTTAVEHFILHGHAEQREFLPLSTPQQYVAQNPALAQAFASGEVSLVEYMIQDLVLGFSAHDIVVAPTLVVWGHEGTVPTPPSVPAPEVPAHEDPLPQLPHPGGPGTGGQAEQDALAMLAMLNQINWTALAQDSVLQSAIWNENLALVASRLGELLPQPFAQYMQNFDVNTVGMGWGDLEDFGMILAAALGIDPYVQVGSMPAGYGRTLAYDADSAVEVELIGTGYATYDLVG